MTISQHLARYDAPTVIQPPSEVNPAGWRAPDPITDDYTVIVLGSLNDVLWACWREPGERRADWYRRAGQMAVAFVEAQK